MSQGEGGGRPTKYNKEVFPKLEEFIALRKSEDHIPTIEGFAYYMGTHKQVLYEWMAKHPMFGDAIKKMLGLQAEMLQVGITTRMNPAGGIFLLKNNHGFKDKFENDVTTGGEKLPTPIYNVNPDVIHTDHSNEKDSEPKRED